MAKQRSKPVSKGGSHGREPEASLHPRRSVGFRADDPIVEWVGKCRACGNGRLVTPVLITRTTWDGETGFSQVNLCRDCRQLSLFP